MVQEQISEEEKILFYGRVAEYLGDSISEENRKHFEKLLEREEWREKLNLYKDRLGTLQMHLQTVALVTEEQKEIQDLFIDYETSLTLEKNKIDEIESSVFRSNVKRRGFLAFSLIVLLFLGYKYLGPKSLEPPFVPLDSLSYEAIAMEEDQSGTRLYLPSEDLGEIKEYLRENSNLGFKPKVFKRLLVGWKYDGASIIDYGNRHIAVVQYQDQKDNLLFHFTLNYQIHDLPDSEQGNYLGLVYQPYGTDQMNIIAWQQDDQTLGVLVGRSSVKKLAEFAGYGSSAMGK